MYNRKHFIVCPIFPNTQFDVNPRNVEDIYQGVPQAEERRESQRV